MYRSATGSPFAYRDTPGPSTKPATMPDDSPNSHPRAPADPVPGAVGTPESDSPGTCDLSTARAAIGLRSADALTADTDQLGWDRGYRTLQVTRKAGKISREPIPSSIHRAVRSPTVTSVT